MNVIEQLSKMEKYQYLADELEKKGVFVGCNKQVFSLTSFVPIELCKQLGLKKEHKLLDIGAGCLRNGFHFIEYLNENNYFAIEPNVKMFETGKEVLNPSKNFTYDNNENYNFEVFNNKFDFIIAFSIWSHAPKKDISTMIKQFSKVGNPGAKFLATFIPPSLKRPDSDATEWVGKSHKSDASGAIGHSREFLIEEADKYSLSIEFLDVETCFQQWIVLSI